MISELITLTAQSVGHQDRFPGKPFAAVLADNNEFSY